jgi:beta-glucosidase
MSSSFISISMHALALTAIAGTGVLGSAQATWISHTEAVARAQQIVKKMTLDEKIAQLHGIRDPEHYRYVPGNARLGIPALNVTNGPAGVGPGGAGSQKPATAWPAPIALAATWEPQLAREYGRLAAEETRSLGSQMLESPDINIARVPQGGRVFESYGEDPYLTARLTVANIEGIQSAGVIANVKHYDANNQETNRGSIDEQISERALHEIYLPAFEAAVKEAHVASVMCAYPRVNGEFNCENKPLLNDVLKREWHFDGFVSSDFGAVHSTVPSALAGLDLELPTGTYFGDKLKAAVQSGEVPVSRIDDMLTRRFAKMIELGWWGPQRPEKPVPVLEHGAVARQIAGASMVLLKDDGGLLPLDRRHIRRVALIGPYAMRAMTGGSGSSHVIPFYNVAPVDGLDEALVQQTPIMLLDGNDIEAAVNAARRADVVILMVGDDEGEDHDHPIALPAVQNALISAVAKANSKTVVVLKSGSAVLMPWLQDVPAVVEAWYPGEEDGHAVADILFGKVNPSGKLPLTFPASVDDTLAKDPVLYPGNGRTVDYGEGVEVGYRGYEAHNVKPLFPFGFGLSYTTFRYDQPEIRLGSNHRSATVRFRLTNTGSVAGAEIAEVYVSFPQISEGNEPPTQLKAFRKIVLAPGESETLDLSLDARAFSYWSEQAHAWKIASGGFHILVGGSSADTPIDSVVQIQ